MGLPCSAWSHSSGNQQTCTSYRTGFQRDHVLGFCHVAIAAVPGPGNWHFTMHAVPSALGLQPQAGHCTRRAPRKQEVLVQRMHMRRNLRHRVLSSVEQRQYVKRTNPGKKHRRQQGKPSNEAKRKAASQVYTRPCHTMGRARARALWGGTRLRLRSGAVGTRPDMAGRIAASVCRAALRAFAAWLLWFSHTLFLAGLDWRRRRRQ